MQNNKLVFRIRLTSKQKSPEKSQVIFRTPRRREATR